jgi:hypothetical protein
LLGVGFGFGFGCGFGCACVLPSLRWSVRWHRYFFLPLRGVGVGLGVGLRGGDGGRRRCTSSGSSERPCLRITGLGGVGLRGGDGGRRRCTSSGSSERPCLRITGSGPPRWRGAARPGAARRGALLGAAGAGSGALRGAGDGRRRVLSLSSCSLKACLRRSEAVRFFRCSSGVRRGIATSSFP